MQTEYQKQWYEANRERISLKGKSEYERNPEKAKQRVRQWKIDNPEKWRAIQDRAHKNIPPNAKLWKLAKSRATKKKWEFNIEPSDIVIPEFCPVLGIRLQSNSRSGPIHSSPTIDRIDSSLGYVKGNIRVISHRANQLKSNATVDELEKIILDLKKIECAKCDLTGPYVSTIN
jgi:hypothetical protein